MSWNAGSEEKFPKKEKKVSVILLQIDAVELRFLSSMPIFLIDIQAPIRHQGSLGLHIHIWYLNPCRSFKAPPFKRQLGKIEKLCARHPDHFADTSGDEGGWSKAFKIFLGTYLDY